MQSFIELIARQPVSVQEAGAMDWLRAMESALFPLLRAGREDELAASLRTACRHWPDSARLCWLLALVLREAQAHELALPLAEQAAALSDDAQTRALLAQIRYESGHSAAADFAAARAHSPDDESLIRSHAGALSAEGDGAQALALMAQTLTQRPGWIEGLNYRATLHRLLGAPGRDDSGFSQAVRAQPGNLALRLGWFHWLAKVRDWEAARAVLSDAQARWPDAPALTIARLFLAAESGEATAKPDLFDGVVEGGAGQNDPGLSLARVRHALRCGAPDKAEEIALQQLSGPAAGLFWPYLSICWRLLGDARATWLDRPDDVIRSCTIDLDADELVELATLLRTLHSAAAPYPDQSVRGGTQTDRPLLFRQEPIMRCTRAAIEAAVRDYIAALPPPEPGHPLLGPPRGEVKFAGSWSVRLSRQGHHAAHSHPAGWISSALHVALPDTQEMGEPPSGWLQFGTPPAELGIALPPYRQIEPQVGRLVLFPSTLWHETLPFADGERLSIAFDIRPPRR